MKQTAVEWFAKEVLRSRQLGFISNEKFNELLEQAKAMEKAQITQSFVGGADFKEMAKNDNKRATAYADQYYRNNYK